MLKIRKSVQVECFISATIKTRKMLFLPFSLPQILILPHIISGQAPYLKIQNAKSSQTGISVSVYINAQNIPYFGEFRCYVFRLGMFNPWHSYSKAMPINILVPISLYFYFFFMLQLYVYVQVCALCMNAMFSSVNFHPSIWGRFAHWIWNLSLLIDWLARKPSGSACSCHPALGLLTQAATVSFLCGCWTPKLRSSCLCSNHLTHKSISSAT